MRGVIAGGMKRDDINFFFLNFNSTGVNLNESIGENL